MSGKSLLTLLGRSNRTRLQFSNSLLHVMQYRSGAPYRGGDVLHRSLIYCRFQPALPSLFVGGGKSSKGSERSNGRKAKSPGPGLSGGERPSSVSSVHSEGDCNRRTPLTSRVWEDRPSSTGIKHINALSVILAAASGAES